MTSETERLRAMLDERGVEYETYIEPIGFEHVKWSFGKHGSADFNIEFGEPWLTMYGTISGPEQAIAATLVDSVATGERQGVAKVYMVEISDELIESWHPLGVYLHKESAEDCAEAYRREEDGVRQFARVIELKVVDA